MDKCNMNILRKFFLIMAVMTVIGIYDSHAVTVTLTTDEGMDHPAGVEAAEKNLAAILTEVNRAQKAKEPVSVKNMVADEFAKKTIARLWAVTPFFCDDNDVVDRLWVFKNGTMMCSHIPLIITPDDHSFGYGTYQEAVVEFDSKGRITDFRLALDAQTAEGMENCGSVADKEKQQIIMQTVERFRTAYNTKDLKTIEDFFSDDALIITGHVVLRKKMMDSQTYSAKVEYTKQNKQEYIANLRKAFLRNKWINVVFHEIGENGEEGGCAGITRSKKNPRMFGVRMRQTWKSSNYSDEGYLFLLFEFPKDNSNPIIHVRTWQPKWAGTIKNGPDDSISTLGGFDL